MNRIAGRIAERGLQKQWVAEKVGISKGALSNIVSGKTKEPSLHVAIRLARVLETTVEDLWGDEA